LAKHPSRGVASFVETDPVSRASLNEAIERSPFVRHLAEAPVLWHIGFSECVDEVLGQPVLKRFRSVATFAFVDPCGLKDLYIENLATILRKPFAECLVFLNYDGLPRWLGGVLGGTHDRARLDRFFGTSDLAAEALASFQSSAPSRESHLLDTYIKALRRESGAKFVLAFRFKATDRNRTSHYLIHLSQHPLAFKIMKDVMRSESSEPEDLGAFGFIPEDELASQGRLFKPNAERARQEVLAELARNPQLARLFLDEWPRRPADMLVRKEYRELLLELEREQRIRVYDREVGLETPAARRRMNTLAEHYEIRLRES
jgi:three-Cys-motif partner protein